MSNTPMVAELVNEFTALQELEEEARQTIATHAKLLTIPGGTVLFEEGSVCSNYVMVLRGSIRVHKVSESGREIVLYRVEPGEACVVTTACLMTDSDYGARGITENEVRAVALPAARFRELLARSQVFRDFAFHVFGARILELILTIEEVAFQRVDVRLAQYLLQRKGQDGLVLATHQEIAAELGTAREVVSRQLKDFEHRGWVALGRGRVMVLDNDLLEQATKKI